jgi:hypothetical protein
MDACSDESAISAARLFPESGDAVPELTLLRSESFQGETTWHEQCSCGPDYIETA